jgi:hypothetical protein
MKHSVAGFGVMMPGERAVIVKQETPNYVGLHGQGKEHGRKRGE